MRSSLRRIRHYGLLAFLTLTSTYLHATTGVFPNAVFDQLDTGLYWFGTGDNYEKAVPGQSNAYYNRNAPTVIYIHGWQNGSTQRASRETWDASDSGGPDVDLAYAWRMDGYNVGILYWNQFADEGEVKDAEAKIWTHSGPRAMRWRKRNGSYSHGPNTSAGQILFESLRDNMADYSGNRLVLAGHSLGNQMALVVTKKLKDGIAQGTANSRLKPKRIALLDPFYSNGSKSYLGGRWVGEVARDYVDEFKAWGVIFEAYRSSATSSTVFVGDENKGLLNKTAFVELKPWYFWAWQQAEKHIAARWHYFWSYDFVPTDLSGTSVDGLSASTSDSRVQSLMNGNKRLIQNRGQYSKSPSDDRQKTGSRL